MKRRIGEHVLEVSFLIHVPKLADPILAGGVARKTHQVHHADFGHDRSEEVRALHLGGCRQEASVAASADGQLFGLGHAGLDQILGGPDEVVEHVLLVQQLAVLVPVLPMLATTP